MSTDIYLVCMSHRPYLYAESDSGQRLSDLVQIRDDIANRHVLVEAWKQDIRPDDRQRYRTVLFLVQHPHCNIGIQDEYDEWYALTDVSCERLEHKDPRPDSHSHGSKTWRFLGETCPLGLDNR